jgi:glucose-1-phosphate cytidylyltransferase
MVEIGGKPILWHIMKHYSHYGINDFIICCGYMGETIKEYFAGYYLSGSDVTFDFASENSMILHSSAAEPWRVTLADTGLDTQTGGRVKRIRPYLDNETFMLTYGDGVSDVDLKKLLNRHKALRLTATLTAVQPQGRYGVLDMNDTRTLVTGFREKSKEDSNWINGGFMVMEPEVFEYLDGDGCILERGPMRTLAEGKRLGVYTHRGFWQCMDTLRDKNILEELWKAGEAPWRVWE